MTRTDTADTWLLALPRAHHSVSAARKAIVEKLTGDGYEDLVPVAQLVVSELVANAVLHTDGEVTVGVRPIPGGVQVSVTDESPFLPVAGVPTESSMTGRGLQLVQRVAARLGAVATADGKRVWADLVGGSEAAGPSDEDPLSTWADEWPEEPPQLARYQVELGDVPVDFLLAAKAHVDNLVRELTLASAGAAAGMTARIPPGLAQLVESVVNRFAEARLAIKRQALAAAREQLPRVTLRLSLTADAADAAEEYLAGLDEADAYCRAARLLTLASPPTHRLFRRWYITELVQQLRDATRGKSPHRSRSFEQCLLDDVDRLSRLIAVAERSARLAAVSSALSGALSPKSVAETVLREGVEALGASGGGILLATDGDALAVPGTVGYDDTLVRKLEQESPDAELPAATSLRTGEAIWIESREDRDTRFPHLAGWEEGVISLCAVPLSPPTGGSGRCA
ncbi:MAG: GAF domain-containing protein [Acidimicrobiales bacterium]